MEKSISNKDKIKLIIDEARGIYIPQNFAKNFNLDEWGINGEEAAPLFDGPDHEEYWDAWEDVLRNAEYTDDKGHKWTLYQDGDLFCVREDYEFPEY